MVNVAIEGLHVALGGRPVLQGITAALAPGRLTGVIGPNGAGKSTLMRAMLGLVPAASGRVMIDGRDIAAMPRRAVATALAYLPQRQDLHWPLTVERLVALGRLPHLGPLSRLGEADEAIVLAALERADVAHLRHREATELSGGERARALLARALAVGAAGILVDEPLAALDPGHQIDVMALLRRETEDGAVVAAVLHDLTMAARHCDRLLLLDDGLLVADGTPAEVLTADNLARVYGVTATIDLNGSAPMVVPLARTEQDRL